MKKTNRLIISILFIPAFFSAYGQNQNNSHNQNSGIGSSISSKLNFVDIDTISHIKINNLIYYKTPIEIFKGKIVDTNYIPDWYESYLIGQNLEKDTNVILKYLHKSCGIKSESGIENIVNDSNNIKSLETLNNVAPYNYILAEVWLTEKTSNQDFVIVLSKKSAIRLKDYELVDPNEINIGNEKLDSLRFAGYDNFVYIKEDGILKFPDQLYGFGLLEKSINSVLNLTLKGFKDLLYRSGSYKQSNLDDKKNRKFQTLEKNGKKHVIKKIEDKP